MSTPERKRLDQVMDRRRARLGLSWEDVANRARLSVATLRRARRGAGDLTLDTKLAIERGLRWADGSVDAILTGGEATELPEVEPVREAGNPFALILDASLEDLFAMCRTVQADQRYGDIGAEKWLADALELRRRARLHEGAAKSEHV